jgi:hypothetical protein
MFLPKLLCVFHVCLSSEPVQQHEQLLILVEDYRSSIIHLVFVVHIIALIRFRFAL